MIQTYKDYLDKAKLTALPTTTSEYLAFSLVGEVGELMNLLKKVLRGDRTIEQSRELIIEELGGIMWYLMMLVDNNQDKNGELYLAIVNHELENSGEFETSAFGAGWLERVGWLSILTSDMMQMIVLNGRSTVTTSGLYVTVRQVREICREFGIDIREVCERNIALLEARAAKGTLQGHNRQDEH